MCRDPEHRPAVAEELAEGLPAAAWRTVTWREGSAVHYALHQDRLVEGKAGDESRKGRTGCCRLLSLGWRVGIVWECALRQQEGRPALQARIVSWVNGTDPFAEFVA